MIKNFIESFESGITPRIRQDGTPSYSLQRFPENGKINWNLKNSKIFDLIKAVSFPYPGAYTYLDNKKIIIWRANINDKICVYGSCGQIFYNSKINKVFVICSSGILSIEKTTFDDGSNALDYLKKKNNQFFDEYFNG